MLDKQSIIGVVGAGTMGRGIAQVAAQAGHRVVLRDLDPAAVESARIQLEKVLARLEEKGRLAAGEARSVLGRIELSGDLDALSPCEMVVEAVVEQIDLKKSVFQELEEICSEQAVLASNTSSLSIAAISSACAKPERVIGLHFFNPAPLLPLVEVVPGIGTDLEITESCRSMMGAWGKTPVIAKDTPGFIVNRVARPFYGEALRIFEEGIADPATIDWAMRELGGFRMGPFELMDLIGHDINYEVSCSVFEAFYYDPRFKPSFTQKRLVEAGRLGRKTGRGVYDYREGAVKPSPNTNRDKGEKILIRILAMLINEAADAVFMNVATANDVDLAMTCGVNYPKGLLAWADELGPACIFETLRSLQEEYGEDRYRPNPLLRRIALSGARFHDPKERR